MNKTELQINVRLQAELKARIQEAAEKSKRTMASEIAYRLERSFDFDTQNVQDAIMWLYTLYNGSGDPTLDATIGQVMTAANLKPDPGSYKYRGDDVGFGKKPKEKSDKK